MACLETNRIGVGVEIDEGYCKVAVERLRKHGIYQQKLLEEASEILRPA
ncbi:MAG: hypothetical protein HY619_07525 [Thaumarchaeota archaeon]|nr:hypothetical protein [Nitrososphaerota archaeon]